MESWVGMLLIVTIKAVQPLPLINEHLITLRRWDNYSFAKGWPHRVSYISCDFSKDQLLRSTYRPQFSAHIFNLISLVRQIVDTQFSTHDSVSSFKPCLITLLSLVRLIKDVNFSTLSLVRSLSLVRTPLVDLYVSKSLYFSYFPNAE